MVFFAQGGGGTFACQCGVNSLFIRIQGDWDSDEQLLYVNLSHGQKKHDTLACAAQYPADARCLYALLGSDDRGKEWCGVCGFCVL